MVSAGASGQWSVISGQSKASESFMLSLCALCLCERQKLFFSQRAQSKRNHVGGGVLDAPGHLTPAGEHSSPLQQSSASPLITNH